MRRLLLGSRLLSILFLILFVAIRPTSPFTMGAPDSACARMEPGHGFTPQPAETAPVKLTLDKTSVVSGQEVRVRLHVAVDGDHFKGFLIQARRTEEKEDKDSQVGHFVTTEASYMTCFSGIHNAITHHDSDPKTKVEAVWTAPNDFEGQVTFRYSFVQEYDRYWVRLDSPDVVRVARSSSSGGTESTSTPSSPLSPSAPLSSPSSSTAAAAVAAEGAGVSSTDSNVHFPDETSSSTSATSVRSSTATTTAKSSTSAAATTTETAASTTEEEEAQLNSFMFLPQNHSILSGCGVTKACFGLGDNNENCVSAAGGASSRCVAVVSYELSGEKWLFKLAGRIAPGGGSGSDGSRGRYFAVGLSYDDRMGEDLTAACVLNNGEVFPQSGYNVGKSNVPLAPSKLGIDDFSGSFEDGLVSCQFKRPMNVSFHLPQSAAAAGGNKKPTAFNLEKDAYVILLAEGEFRGGVLQYHDRKIKSSAPQALGVVRNLAGASRILIQLHGSFMIGAWIFAASCGIILARYYKLTWTQAKCCGLDQWFVWHRLFMSATWLLTVAGFVLIFLELNGWTDVPLDRNPHAVLGCITTGLCFLQPFVALLRCSPGHRRRPIFNWIHWLMGNAAQIVGIIAIFFAVELDKASLPRVTDYLLIAFVAFHFLMHLILSLHQCSTDMRRGQHKGSSGSSSGGYSGYPMRALNKGYGAAGGGSSNPDYEELKRDAPGGAVRKFFLSVYLLVSGVAAAALILLVIYGNFENVIY